MWAVVHPRERILSRPQCTRVTVGGRYGVSIRPALVHAEPVAGDPAVEPSASRGVRQRRRADAVGAPWTGDHRGTDHLERAPIHLDAAAGRLVGSDAPHQCTDRQAPAARARVRQGTLRTRHVRLTLRTSPRCVRASVGFATISRSSNDRRPGSASRHECAANPARSPRARPTHCTEVGIRRRQHSQRRCGSNPPHRR